MGKVRWLLAVLLVLGLALPIVATQEPTPQEPAPQPPQEDQPAAPAAEPQAGPGPGRGGGAPGPRPFAQVVTREARSTYGVFNVHQVRERLLYEIPKEMLGREFLWVSQIAKTTLGAGYGGQAAGNRVVRWERRDNRILLRSRSYAMVADPGQPIARAVEAANFDPIVAAFNIEALGQNDSAVIDVGRLFLSDIPEFSGRTRARGRGFDAARSFIERARAFPQNVEVEAIQTYVNPPDAGGAGAPAGRGLPPARAGALSVVMHYSMVLLPQQPMQARAFDERVGFFSVGQLDYGRDEHRSPQTRYITRWRLEKKDPNAAISEPIKPITYYIDPATPTKWVPFVKKGVEDWQPAFEAAGFRNAIVAREAPSTSEDPDWSPEDARYSVIRWLPSTTENASGPHINDPRSGEIIETDIQMHHNVMNLVRDWYFVQVGPLDPRARRLPLPDDLMGRLIQYVVTHEVGHTLGLQHNMKASSMYPADKVRDPQWVKTMSHTPTLMDYSRFNYVAQPEDKIPVEDLIPKVGPYDVWAIGWGYKPIPGARSADEEKKTLDQWAREQDDKPYLRFSTAGSDGADPGEQSEAVGDENAVASTRLGLKNLERVATMLIPAAEEPGEPYDDLEELYGRMMGQWATEMSHVASVVGGVHSQQKHWGQNGLRFQTLPRDRQAEAVAFLNEHAFQTPKFALDPAVLRRIEPNGALTRIRSSQQRVLDTLLASGRLMRLVEQEAFDPDAAYRPVDFLADVREGVWSELSGRSGIRIDAYRRNLQRAYVETLALRVNGRAAAADDARALFRAELSTLDGEIRSVLSRAADPMTAAHLADVRVVIARALDPTVRDAPAGPVGPAGPLGIDEDTGDPTCWPDYAVRN
jgi:hypothetical protein